MAEKNETKPNKNSPEPEKNQSFLEGKPPLDKNSLLAQKLIKNPETVPILFHDVRRRIILLLMDSSMTLRQLSNKMDLNPGTMKRYLEDLLKHGLIKIEKEEQNEFGINQIFYRTTAQNFIVEINFKGQYGNFMDYQTRRNDNQDQNHMEKMDKKEKHKK